MGRIRESIGICKTCSLFSLLPHPPLEDEEEERGLLSIHGILFRWGPETRIGGDAGGKRRREDRERERERHCVSGYKEGHWVVVGGIGTVSCNPCFQNEHCAESNVSRHGFLSHKKESYSLP